jgi:hypothetical protein
MHMPLQRWVTFCRAASAPARKVYPQYLPRPPADVGTAMGHNPTPAPQKSGTPWHISGSRPPSYSMTSSARASSEGGTVRPSVLAVLRLMISSNLVDCITGRSAGFSPLRIRPV